MSLHAQDVSEHDRNPIVPKMASKEPGALPTPMPTISCDSCTSDHNNDILPIYFVVNKFNLGTRFYSQSKIPIAC